MATKYTLISNLEALLALLVTAEKAGYPTVAFDTETDSLDAWKANITGCSLSWEEGIAYYIPLAHLSGPNIPLDDVRGPISDLLQKSHVIYHNAKFDWQVCDKAGIARPGSYDDTMLAAHSLAYAEIGLKSLAMQILKLRMTTLEDLFGSRKKISFPALTPEAATPYAAADADVTLRLWHFFGPKAKDHFIYKLERDLQPEVTQSEETGIMIDKAFMDAEAKRLTKELEIVADAFYDLIAEALKIDSETARVMYPVNSPVKMGELLYDKLGLPCHKSTKAGRRSTDGDALEPYRNRNSIATNLLAVREIARQRDGYFIKLQAMADPNSRIHSNFNQCGASSGRFASSGPNLQNISKKVVWKIHLVGGEVREVEAAVRRSFISRPGCYLLEMDQSQVELRFMAGVAQDKTLLKAFARNEDIHRRTAAFCFTVPEDQVTKKQRDDGKTTNFALIYGMGPDHFYRELEGRFDMETVKKMHQAFFELYPGIIPFHIKTRGQTRITHSVISYFGRFQWIPEYELPGAWNQSKADRAGVNRIVQGSCADMMKIVIVRVQRHIRKLGWDKLVSPIINYQHDGLHWEIDNSLDPSDVANEIAKVATLQFPGFPVFRVNFKSGTNWADMTDVSFTDPIPYESIPAAPSTFDVEGQTFTYELEEITKNDAIRLRDLLAANPGPNTFLIRLADKGDLSLDKWRTSLTPASPQVQALLGGSSDTESAEAAVASAVEVILD